MSEIISLLILVFYFVNVITLYDCWNYGFYLVKKKIKN
jgi:hypothetical protein